MARVPVYRVPRPAIPKVSATAVWRWLQLAIFLVFILLGAKTAIYTIDTDSAGVVKRFGKYHRTTGPGIHLLFPFWIETATEVPVTRNQKEEFGFRTMQAGVDSRYLGIEELDRGQVPQDDLKTLIRESGEGTFGQSSSSLRSRVQDILRGEYIMLTGDLNIVDVEWIVQYKIKEPRQYLFNVRDPRYTIRDASQSVMRQLIGNGSVDEAITIGRIEYENNGKDLLQELLDEYETGIHIVTVKMQSSNPPLRVRPAFNEVNKSQQQKEQRINEAMKLYNEVIPKTIGEAKRVIETAKGYAAERVNQAEGDVAKFAKVLVEYQKAPEITRRRLYIETMSKVLPEIPEKWILEQGGAEGGILLKLDLDKEM